MKLLTFSKGVYKERLGIVIEGKVVDFALAYKIVYNAEPPDWFISLDNLIRGGEMALELAKDVEKELRKSLQELKDVSYSPEEVEYHPPLKYVEKILCASLNYKSHAEELGKSLPTEPYLFMKLPNVLVAHKRPIIVPKFSNQVDYEGELAIIIGKVGKNISKDKAFDYVFGYTIFNDVSLRDLRWGKSGKTEFNWFKTKSLDNLGPIGPWIVTKDEIPNPHNLRIRTYVNDELRQDGNTEDMIFDISTLIEYASESVTLRPGDIISTGTPPGTALRTGKFLRHKDIVKINIEKIGELENQVIYEGS
jgi:2-keto-4-pentenoate hydratase/2-oxohepta-3-ene-1,7-dioic acid hydratase in catechol pathway